LGLFLGLGLDAEVDSTVKQNVAAPVARLSDGPQGIRLYLAYTSCALGNLHVHFPVDKISETHRLEMTVNAVRGMEKASCVPVPVAIRIGSCTMISIGSQHSTCGRSRLQLAQDFLGTSHQDTLSPPVPTASEVVSRQSPLQE